MITVTGIPFPPSMNHRYIPCRGRLILSPEHRAYKALLSTGRGFIVINKSEPGYFRGKPLFVTIEYVGPYLTWFTKTGAIRKIDVDNRHKTMLDVILPLLGLDDSQAFTVKFKKVVEDVPRTYAHMRIEEYAGA